MHTANDCERAGTELIRSFDQFELIESAFAGRSRRRRLLTIPPFVEGREGKGKRRKKKKKKKKREEREIGFT